MRRLDAHLERAREDLQNMTSIFNNRNESSNRNNEASGGRPAITTANNLNNGAPSR